MLKKYKSYLQIFLVFSALFLLDACGRGGYPWDAAINTGVVTKDKESQPDIAWQTESQRQELTQQSAEITQQPSSPVSAEAAAAVPVLPSGEAAPSPDMTADGLPIPAAVPVPPPAVKKMKVSILLPLSGRKADLGQSMLKAAQMALFDVGSANFELVPRDTKSTPEGAAAAATAAAAAHSDLILGPVFADDLKAVKPAAVAAGIPVVSFTTDWTLADGRTYIMGFLPFAQVVRVAQYTKSKGYSKFAVYAPKTEYCDVVIRTLENSGVSIVKTSRYAPNQPDLGLLAKDFAETSKNKSIPDGPLDFDALLLPIGSEGLKSLVTFFESNGVDQTKAKFIGTGLWDDPELTGYPPLFGGWFAAPNPVLREDFIKRYQENFAAVPVRLASLAYDATALAAVLARTAQGDASPYTPAAMTNPRGFAGIDGIFRFRPDGLSERGLAILEIQSGRTRVVDPAPTAFFSASGS